MRDEGARQLPLAWMFKEVSHEIGDEVRPIIRPQVAEKLSERRALRRQERALRRIIESDTLTREELEAALANMRVATDRYHAKLHGIGVDVLLALDVSERTAAAPYLFRPPQSGRGGPRRPQEGRRFEGRHPGVQPLKETATSRDRPADSSD